MAFCSHCGARLPENQRFCSECGAAQPMGAPAAAPNRNTPPRNPNPNPNIQRPAQVNQAPNGPEYTTYIPKQTPASTDQTTYLPRRPGNAPQQSHGQPQQSYSAPQQSYSAPQQSYTIPQQNATVVQDVPMDTGKKKSGKSKVGIIVLILVLLAALGVGGFFLLKGDSDNGDAPAVDSSLLGVYGAVDEDGNDIRGEWLELMDKGKGELRLDGETYKFRWELDDEDLTIVQAKDEYTGTLIDGEIILDINGDTFTYRHEDWEAPVVDTPPEEDFTEAAPAETEAPAEDPTDPNTLAFWEGDYYGWWIVNDVYEGDTSDEGKWWDCFANVSFNRDGTAWVTVWDEDGSRSEPLGEVKMEITLVDYGVVEFNSISGGFGGCDVEYGQWYCRSDDDTDFDQTFWFSATYNDGEGLHFDYTFYMRPWGHDWKDVAREAPDLLPGYYEDWYLPLIEAGVKKAPDSIN